MTDIKEVSISTIDTLTLGTDRIFNRNKKVHAAKYKCAYLHSFSSILHMKVPYTCISSAGV
jgi:hypothetical protein